MRKENPGKTIPEPVRERQQWRLLKAAQLMLFAGFMAMQMLAPPAETGHRAALPPPADARRVRLFSLGEPTIAARLLGFWLLRFDSRAGEIVPFEALDYRRLTGWLETIQTLDPRSDMPLMTAAGVFSEVNDPERIRHVIRFIRGRFREAPARRWRWMAQAVLLAKYRLNDLALAERLAADLRTETVGGAIPAWARDLQIIILQDMGEYETARRLIEAMLEHGTITDPAELRFLTARLEELRRELERR